MTGSSEGGRAGGWAHRTAVKRALAGNVGAGPHAIILPANRHRLFGDAAYFVRQGGDMVSRLATVLLVCFLSGCVYVPLPDTAPPLPEVRLPSSGDSVAEVRRVFGDPQVLDSGHYLLYDWTTDRRFVVVPLFPTGLPGAAVVAGHRFRMRVVLDDSQTVSSVDCSAEKMDSRQLVEFGCLDPAELARRVGQGDWRELTDINELAEVRFWHPEMNGSNTHMVLSPDGRILAASDVENRTWLIDIDSFNVVGRHDNARPNFWSLKGVPEPRVAFAADGRRLVITQGELTTFMTRAGDRFVPGAHLNGRDIEVARFVCCPDGLVGLGSGRASWITADGEVHIYTDKEGRFDFGVSGVGVTRPAPPGTLRLAALDSAVLAPSPRAVFAENSRQNAVLDTRNDFARHRATANFEFSPDGLWLARNSCRHLELWDSGQLSQLLSEEGPETLSPFRAMMVPLLPQASYDDGCHGPIVFHPDGKLVAAASDKAIHIWRIADGRQETLIDVEEGRYGLHVVAIAFDTDRGLAAVVSDYRGTIHVARWKLTD